MLRILHTHQMDNLDDNISGGDALTGDTRSHPEHDGQAVSGRWYYTGDGMGEQVAARSFYPLT